MLSYTIKSKVDNVEYNSELLFNDLLSNDETRGQIHPESSCWLCNNELIGHINENDSEQKKYYIYFKCKNCQNGAEISVPKCSVKFKPNTNKPQNSVKKIEKSKLIQETEYKNQISTKQIKNDTVSNTMNQLKKNSIINRTHNLNNQTIVSSPTNNTSNVTHRQPQPQSTRSNSGKFISYKNQVLFHEPILGDPNSGNIHSSCCSNKCKKCGGRLSGKSTRLDENKVSLFWKCSRCEDRHDIIASNDELD